MNRRSPAEYKRVTVSLPLPQWQQLLAGTPEDARNAVLSSVRKQEISLDLEAIKQALNLEKLSRARTSHLTGQVAGKLRP